MAFKIFPTLAPVHQHDCDRCRYFGTMQDMDDKTVYDVYLHGVYHDNGTVIARYGIDADYYSRPAELIRYDEADSIVGRAANLIRAQL